MLRPIHVYLDSSDYSRFAQECDSPRDPRLKAVLTHLERLISESKIIIRYSALHIFEATHLVQSARPRSISRARMIARLSGAHCLRPYFELPVYDVFRYILNTRNKQAMLPFPEYAFSDDGEWYPDLSGTVSGWRSKLLRQQLWDHLKASGISRVARIRLEKSLFNQGRVTPELQKLMLDSSPELLFLDPNQFPVTGRFYEDAYPRRFLFGDIEAEEFAAEMARGAFDPVNFIGIYFDRFDSSHKTATWLRNLGGQLVSTILESQNQLGFLGEVFPPIKRREKALPKQLTAELASLSRELKVKHLQGLVKEWNRGFDKYSIRKKYALDVISSNPDLSPSFTAFVDTYKQYYIDNLDKFENVPRPEESAIGDIFHAIYLPYVDVFRADRHFADQRQLH